MERNASAAEQADDALTRPTLARRIRTQFLDHFPDLARKGTSASFSSGGDEPMLPTRKSFVYDCDPGLPAQAGKGTIDQI